MGELMALLGGIVKGPEYQNTLLPGEVRHFSENPWAGGKTDHPSLLHTQDRVKALSWG
jgi:hypothetical protein